MSDWPRVALSEVMSPVEDPARVNPEAVYPNLGIYSFARGVFGKPPIDGAKTSARTLYRVKGGQFIYSKLFAFEGAYALVPPSMDGYFVSNEYPTFDCDPDRVLPGFLRWLFSFPPVWRAIALDSKGMGDRRRRVYPEQVLAYEIPLPPLDEQRRIVARLDRVAARVEALQTALAQIADERRALLTVLARRSDLPDADKRHHGWSRVPLSQVLRPAAQPVRVSPEDSYPNLGIYSFGRGVFAKPSIDGAATSASVLYRVRAGYFIYSRLFAFEGAFAIVPQELDGAFVSNEFPSFEIVQESAAGFLRAYFSDPQVWRALAVGSLGLGSRRQRVNEHHLLSHELWLPPEVERMRLNAVVTALERGHDSETSGDLVALVLSVLHEIFGGKTSGA